jgi:FAD/FMN-containing dehydrogenase
MMDEKAREQVRMELVGAIGEGKVLWHAADLAPYTKDTYRIRFEDDFRFFPDFVVLPETTADVQSIVRIASGHKIPLIPKGGGSSRTGMLVPVHGGIVVDTIKMTNVLEVSVPDLYVTCQPGITLKELDEKLKDHGVSLNQEQGSFKIATVGGSISTSGFSRKHQKYGSISDRVMSLEVVLADGRILRTGPKVLYTSTGYRLSQLFIGAEGTLGIITEATLRVEPLPEAKDAVLAFYDDYWAADEAARRTMGSGVTFTGGEACGVESAEEYGGPREKKGIYYLGLEGTKGEVEAELAFVTDIVKATGGILASNEAARKFMERYTIQWCGARVSTGFEDPLTTYVPMERIADFYGKLYDEIMPRYDTGPLPGEKYSLDFGRYRMSAGRYFIPKGEGGWEKHRKMLREIAELATSLGGSISSCHGVGIEHRDNIELEYSEVALDAMRSIKEIFDPDNIMNPGKKIPERKRA